MCKYAAYFVYFAYVCTCVMYVRVIYVCVRHVCVLCVVYIMCIYIILLSCKFSVAYVTYLSNSIICCVVHAGSIPSEIGSLTNMQSVDLSNNHLHGTVCVRVSYVFVCRVSCVVCVNVCMCFICVSFVCMYV